MATYLGEEAKDRGRTPRTELSASEDALREQLYTSFKDKGVVRSLKAQLRNRLASDLLQGSAHAQDHQTGGQHTSPHRSHGHDAGRAEAESGPTLVQQVADSLLRQHLESSHYDYTLSVFLAERKHQDEPHLSMHDIRRQLGLKASAGKHAKKRSKSRDGREGRTLVELIERSLEHHSREMTSCGTQTDQVPRKQLEERLAEMEASFTHRQSSLQSGTEERMLNFQSQCRQQCQDDLIRYKMQYAATETAKMQLEERKRYDEKLLAVRREYEHQHENRAQSLRLREQESSLAFQKRQQELESELFQQRQSLLQQMEQLRQKEAGVQQCTTDLEQQLQKQLSQVEKEKEQVVMDRRKYQQEAEDFQQRVQNEVQRRQLQIERELQEKTIGLVSAQGNLKDRETELAQRSQSFERLSAELSSVRDRLLETREKLHRAIEDRNSTVHQRDRLQSMLAEVKDHSVLKEQVVLLNRQLESANQRAADARDALRQQQEGHESMAKELTTKLSLTSPEVATLKDELKHARDEARRQGLVAKETHNILVQRLQLQTNRSDEIGKQLQELQVREKSLLLESDDLKRLLAQAEAALSHPSTGSHLHRKTTSFRKSRDFHNLPDSESSVNSAPALLKSRHRRTPNQKHAKSVSIAPAHGRVENDLHVEDLDVSESSEAEHSRDHWSVKLNDSLSHQRYFQQLEQEAKDLEKSYEAFQSRLGGAYSLAAEPSLGIGSHPVPTGLDYSLLAGHAGVPVCHSRPVAAAFQNQPSMYNTSITHSSSLHGQLSTLQPVFAGSAPEVPGRPSLASTFIQPIVQPGHRASEIPAPLSFVHVSNPFVNAQPLPGAGSDVGADKLLTTGDHLGPLGTETTAKLRGRSSMVSEVAPIPFLGSTAGYGLRQSRHQPIASAFGGDDGYRSPVGTSFSAQYQSPPPAGSQPQANVLGNPVMVHAPRHANPAVLPTQQLQQHKNQEAELEPEGDDDQKLNDQHASGNRLAEGRSQAVCPPPAAAASRQSEYERSVKSLKDAGGGGNFKPYDTTESLPSPTMAGNPVQTRAADVAALSPPVSAVQPASLPVVTTTSTEGLATAALASVPTATIRASHSPEAATASQSLSSRDPLPAVAVPSVSLDGAWSGDSGRLPARRVRSKIGSVASPPPESSETPSNATGLRNLQSNTSPPSLSLSDNTAREAESVTEASARPSTTHRISLPDQDLDSKAGTTPAYEALAGISTSSEQPRTPISIPGDLPVHSPPPEYSESPVPPSTEVASEVRRYQVGSTDAPGSSASVPASRDARSQGTPADSGRDFLLQRQTEQRLRQERDAEETLRAEQEALATLQLEQENEKQLARKQAGVGEDARPMSETSVHSKASQASQRSSLSRSSHGLGDAKGNDDDDIFGDDVDPAVQQYMQQIKANRASASADAGADADAAKPSTSSSTKASQTAGLDLGSEVGGDQQDWDLQQDSAADSRDKWGEASGDELSEWG